MVEHATYAWASPPLVPPRGWVGSGYGWRLRARGHWDLHTGIDLGAPEGWPVVAVLAGTVVLAAPSGSRGWQRYGNVVVLEHAPGVWTLYAHLESIAVREGERVVSGQLLGGVGRSAGTIDDPGALTDGPHLHLELLTWFPPRGRDLDRPDPTPWLAQLGVLAEPHAPIRIVRGSPADTGARGSARRNAPASRTAGGAIAGAGLLLLLLALAWSAR